MAYRPFLVTFVVVYGHNEDHRQRQTLIYMDILYSTYIYDSITHIVMNSFDSVF